MKSNAVVKIFATALFACGALAANSAGFDGMTLVTNDWFDASFTSLAVDTTIATNTTTGITLGAGTWTEAPTNGTATIVADADAGGGATFLSLNAPGEMLKFTPASLSTPSGMETVTAEVKITPVDGELPAISAGAQGAFTLKVDGEGTLTVHGQTAEGWTNLVNYASVENLTNDWVTVAMDFATVSNVRYVRYSVTVGGSRTVLEDSDGTSWFPAGVNATTVTAVGFSGIGNIRSFSGDSLAEPVATCNGVNYATVADAIAAAEDGDTITLVKTAYNELISITKNVSINLNANPLNCDAFDVASGITLTVVNTGNKQIKVPCITGGGDIVATKSLRLCFTDATATSTIGSIDVVGDFSIDTGSKGTVNVVGENGVSVSGTLIVRDVALNVAYTLSASAVNMEASANPGENEGVIPTQTLVSAGTLNAVVYGSGKVIAPVVSGAGGQSFVGNITATTFEKTNSGDLTLYGTNAVGNVNISGGRVILGNPYSLGTIMADFDASVADKSHFDAENSYIEDVNGGSVILTNLTGYTVERKATEGVLGGNYALYSSNLRISASAKLSSSSKPLTTFMVWNRVANSVNYEVVINNTSRDKYGIHRHNNFNYYSWRVYGGYKDTTNNMWLNGVAGSPVGTKGDQLLTVCGGDWLLYASDVPQYGTSNESYIGEILTYSTKFTLDQRVAIEAYLMDKWGIGDVVYSTVPTNANVALSNDAVLDLGGLVQKLQSVSGSGIISNGTLTVVDPISVAVGNALVIPYGSTYTRAPGIGEMVDESAGTITLKHCAADIDGVIYDTVADAILAYESGTLTIHESATLDFGTTEVSASNVVLDDGVTLTFAQNLPWTSTYDGDAGTIVNTRVASTYVWTPGENETAWATLSNWRISSATPVALPGANDTVSFASSGTVTLSANVDVGTLSIADAIRVQFTAESLKNLVVGDYIYGSGTTNALSNIKLVPQEKDVAYTLDIGGIVEIVDGTHNQIRATSHRVDGNNKPAMTLTISGNLIGGGNVEFGSNSGASRAYVNLSGDNSGFTGVATINGNNTGSFRWMSADSGSASARWVTDNAPTMNFGFTDGTLKLGSFETSTGVSLASNSTPSLEIGGYGTDSELGSNFARGSSSKSLNLVKTGSGKLVFSGRIANGNGQGNITIENGTLDIAAQQSLPNAGSALTMTGGILAVSGTTTDAEENTVFVDPSAYIKNCTTYPITFSNAVGEVHAWATALAASNTGGLVKKGAGTLVLKETPAYTGDTYLEGGILQIPATWTGRVETNVPKMGVYRSSKTIDGVKYKVYWLDKLGSIAIIY